MYNFCYVNENLSTKVFRIIGKTFLRTNFNIIKTHTLLVRKVILLDYFSDSEGPTNKTIIFIKYVLFRTRNLGQHFLDISKKNDVNQSLVSLINDNY
jgi:hypothetical protein